MLLNFALIYTYIYIYIYIYWAIPEKIRTVGVEDTEFRGVSKKWHAEFPGVN